MKRKNFILTGYLFIFVLLLASCTKDFDSKTIDLNPESVFNNSIGTLNNEGEFNRLDRIDVNRVIKSELDLSFNNKNIEFQDFVIKQELYEDKQKRYFLSTTSTDKSASVSVKLIQDAEGNLILTKDTCKCESTDCPNGCNASGAGSTCRCSSCFQACKKTSTSEEEIAP